jgi:hypothetical protein
MTGLVSCGIDKFEHRTTALEARNQIIHCPLVKRVVYGQHGNVALLSRRVTFCAQCNMALQPYISKACQNSKGERAKLAAAERQAADHAEGGRVWKIINMQV